MKVVMKKSKKPKILNKPKVNLKVNLPKKIAVFKKTKTIEEKLTEAVKTVPKINQETVSEHREEVLAKARKYIYPLRHTRKRIVLISINIFIGVLVLFSVFVYLSLYRYNSTSRFMYGVTQVIPLPVAKVDGRFVSYNSYLFELRRYMHYYESQQQVNFSSLSGQKQLKLYMQSSMSQAITNAYVKVIAQKDNITISAEEVNNQVNLVRSQNRLGSSQAEFNTVLSNFWGWTESDFERALKDELLQAAVLARLDVSANNLAQNVLNQLNKGGNFSQLAEQYSQDNLSKGNGGLYSGLILENDPNVSPNITQALFSLKVGQHSRIINTGNNLEIVQVLKRQNNEVQAAHIVFHLNNINSYISKLESKQKPEYFINY